MGARLSLIGELELAVQSGSAERRVDTLRRITDLFLVQNERLTDEQIGVFDDVLGHLIKRIESKALVELSERLAPIEKAPIEVIRRLARDEEIAVAAPILTLSTRLSTTDLIDIAKTKGQAHLLALSGRQHLQAPVTDILLERGNHNVFHRLAASNTAAFSEDGFSRLVKASEDDQSLIEALGLRIDMPLHLFKQLLLRASQAVRERLMSRANPEHREAIREVLSDISSDLEQHAIGAHDFQQAEQSVTAMKANGELDEIALLEFVKDHKYAETIVALSLLCSAPVPFMERIFNDGRPEAMLIPCKAAGISWPTLRAIYRTKWAGSSISQADIEHAKSEYLRLSKATAQRVLRFWSAKYFSGQPDARAISPDAEAALLDSRKQPRAITAKTGRIPMGFGKMPAECAIIDMSSIGACLLVSDTAAIPPTFELTIDSDRKTLRCRVTWKAGGKVGVSFEQPAGLSD